MIVWRHERLGKGGIGAYVCMIARVHWTTNKNREWNQGLTCRLRKVWGLNKAERICVSAIKDHPHPLIKPYDTRELLSTHALWVCLSHHLKHNRSVISGKKFNGWMNSIKPNNLLNPFFYGFLWILLENILKCCGQVTYNSIQRGYK